MEIADYVLSIGLETLREVLIEEARFFSRVNDQVEQVSRELKTIHCFLRDVDGRQNINQFELERNWVNELKELANKAENLLERYAVEVASTRQGNLKKLVKKYVVCGELSSLHEIGKEAEVIRSSMNELSKRLTAMTQSSNAVEDHDPQVHAYERMNRVYNYTLDSCGPAYITVGDGGNIKKVDVDHADEPGKCPPSGDNVPEFGGVCHMNFSFGPAKGMFCRDTQPEWSAYRECNFGHGILELINEILPYS